LEELKVEPVDEKLRRYKSNWLQHVTRMNNMMQKIMLIIDQMGVGRRINYQNTKERRPIKLQ
jgi:hypothetical protein